MTQMVGARALKLAVAGAAMALTAPGQAAGDDGLRYAFKAGDTLSAFGQRFLARPGFVRTVQRINRIRDPRRIPIGTQITIPRDLLRYEPVNLQVANWSGPVRIEGRPVTVGSRFEEGQSIATGRRGFISFAVAGGGSVALPSNSRARLERARRYVLGNTLDVMFTVLDGRGEAKVRKLKDQERFEMRTPVAVTAVRGTQFRVAFDEGAARGGAEVVEGSVAVEAAGEARMTQEGFGVASSAAGLGATEALLPPPPFADPGAIRTGEEIEFTVGQGVAAQAFRVQIARDAGFLDVLEEAVGPAGAVTFASLEDGRYFVRGRAIAESGLEGLSESYTFRRKRLGVEASAEPSPLADGYLFKWAPVGAGSTFFAFQLWDQATPGRLLVDETGLSATGAIITDLVPGRYNWRVAAVQGEEDGLLKVWGPSQTLVVSE